SRARFQAAAVADPRRDAGAPVGPCVSRLIFETDRSGAAKGGTPSTGTCSRWLLLSCRLLGTTRGMLASSLTLVTVYCHWFQMPRAFIRLPLASPSTLRPCCGAAPARYEEARG